MHLLMHVWLMAMNDEICCMSIPPEFDTSIFYRMNVKAFREAFGKLAILKSVCKESKEQSLILS
jgi:hypothetical protein